MIFVRETILQDTRMQLTENKAKVESGSNSDSSGPIRVESFFFYNGEPSPHQRYQITFKKKFTYVDNHKFISLFCSAKFKIGNNAPISLPPVV